MSVKAPVVTSKTLGPSQVLEFMGIELDSTRMEAMQASRGQTLMRPGLITQFLC